MDLKFPPESNATYYTSKIPTINFSGARQGWFRFKNLGDKVLLTNDVGDFIFITSQEFDIFASGRMPPEHPTAQKLSSNGFLIPWLDVEKIVERYRKRHSYLGLPPFLHIVIPTLRCNTTCVYCHAGRASMKDRSVDMDLKTAKLVTDFIFKTPSKDISIEFQGGEPLANFEVVKFIIEYARELNKQQKRNLQFLLVTNLSLMDENKMRFLLDNDVLLCTSIDGTKQIHDSNRKLPGKSSFDVAVEWLKRINQEYTKMGRDPDLWHVDALLTTSRNSLNYPHEIVDTYVSLGIKTIHIRPLNPMGFASKLKQRFSYQTDEFLEFYFKALDYIIDLNEKGVEIIERQAALFLAKILGDEDPGYVDLRSPCGAGMGQLAYSYDGSIFSCDEGRMVSRMGDHIFKVGEVSKTTYEDICKNKTLRALAIASCLEALPGCKNCVYLPYCGICPVFNYVTQKSLFGQMVDNERCKINRGILDYLFSLLEKKQDNVKKIFQRWIIQKPRLKNLAGGA